MNSLKNILIGIAHVKYSEDDWGNNYEVKTITSVEDQIVNYFTDYDCCTDSPLEEKSSR